MPFNPYQAQIDDLKAKITTNQELLQDPDLGELARLEVTELENQVKALESAAQTFASNMEGSEEVAITEHVNCTLEIRPGAGGDEATIWSNDLLRMYLRFAEKLGLKYEFLDETVVKCKGRIHTFDLHQDGSPVTAYDLFKYESGVHRVQRVPATEAQGRIHTSTASVAVLPEVSPRVIEIKDDELDWQFTRSGGAGGQNVNKVNTAVRLTHKPTGIVVTSRQERSQSQNRDVALGLLRSQLWEVEEEKRLQALGEARSVIGRAQRAEKIRTYNYAQNRVTDHRINVSWYDLEQIMEGKLEEIVKTLHQELGSEQQTSEEIGEHTETATADHENISKFS